jgi:hypothetical protein
VDGELVFLERVTQHRRGVGEKPIGEGDDDRGWVVCMRWMSEGLGAVDGKGVM